MGLGYRSRFQPLLNRDWYLWYTHDGTYHSPLPSVPYSSSIAHHMRVLGFSECFGGRNSPPQPSSSLHILVFRRTNVRDITRAHAIVKPKAINVNKGCQGRALSWVNGRRGVRGPALTIGTKYFAPFDKWAAVATLPGGGECRGRRFKLIRRSSTDRVEGAHLAEGRLLSR